MGGYWMKYIREASEDEMILVFLQGEIKSERFHSQIVSVLDEIKLSTDIIEHADLNKDEENQKRKEILRIFRGYGSNMHLFENYPKVIRWIFAECTKEDIHKIRYINYSYWNELSKYTRSPLIAADTIREGKEIYGVSNIPSINGVKYLEEGGTFSPIILLTADNENYTILEGHSRMTVYGLASHFFEGSKCYIGICEEHSFYKWNS
jgi:hypothetical protein